MRYRFLRKIRRSTTQKLLVVRGDKFCQSSAAEHCFQDVPVSPMLNLYGVKEQNIIGVLDIHLFVEDVSRRG